MMLAGGSKTDELAKAMPGFRDSFLVGFFLTIGLAEMVHVSTVAALGMGRMGTAAYDNPRQKYEKTVVGLNFDEVRMGQHDAAL